MFSKKADLILSSLLAAEIDPVKLDDFYEILAVSQIYLLVPKAEPHELFYYALNKISTREKWPFFFSQPILALLARPLFQISDKSRKENEIFPIKGQEYFEILYRHPAGEAAVVMNPTGGHIPGRRIFRRPEMEKIVFGPWGRRVVS